MVLKELELIAKVGMKAASMAGIKKADVEKHLAPLVKAKKLTKAEAKSFAKDIIAVGKKHHAKIRTAVQKEVEKGLKKRGYVKAKPKRKAAKKKVVKKKAAKRKVAKKRKPAKRKK